MLLIAKAMGFNPTLLLRSEATRDAETSTIKNAAEILQEKDILMVTYSGHAGEISGNYSEFHKKVASLLPPIHSPNYFNIGQANLVFDNQKPFTI